MRWPWKSKGSRTSRPVRVRLGGRSLPPIEATAEDIVRRGLRVRGRYDAAQTTADNRQHWAWADYLSVDAASSPEVRRVLRARARYEVANNSFGRGIVESLANDLVGTGPRLQLLTPDAALNRTVERHFREWSAAVKLAQKLRTMRKARAQDGEAFALLTTSRALATDVKLDLALVEADQVSTPDMGIRQHNAVDGIVLDDDGNPVEYHVLKVHPGSLSPWLSGPGFGDYDRVPASAVIHWFRHDRPGQHRGVPDLMPALPLFALLRRYCLAVLEAAETAANMAVIMETNAPPEDGPAAVENVTLELERNTATFAPEGWKVSQLKAEQPSQVFDPYVRAVLREIARCVLMPYSIAACDSSGLNFASGQLDQKTYYKGIEVERSETELTVLDPTFESWMREEALLLNLVTDPAAYPHEWFWDGLGEHMDPAKVGLGQDRRLRNFTTTAALEAARTGHDYEELFVQRSREISYWTKYFQGLGLALEQAVNLALGEAAGPAGASAPVKEPGEEE